MLLRDMLGDLLVAAVPLLMTSEGIFCMLSGACLFQALAFCAVIQQVTWAKVGKTLSRGLH